MKCTRCGWSGKTFPPVRPGPGAPQIPGFDPHPPGTCTSKFKIGDEVVWNGGGLAEDLPPIVGTFVALTEFLGPDYELEDGVWKRLSEAAPSIARLKLDMSTVTDAHREIFTAEIDAATYPVAYSDLALPSEWPTFEIS